MRTQHSGVLLGLGEGADFKLIPGHVHQKVQCLPLEDSGWLLRGGLWVHYSRHDVYEVRICDPCLD